MGSKRSKFGRLLKKPKQARVYCEIYPPLEGNTVEFDFIFRNDILSAAVRHFSDGVFIQTDTSIELLCSKGVNNDTPEISVSI